MIKKLYVCVSEWLSTYIESGESGWSPVRVRFNSTFLYTLCNVHRSQIIRLIKSKNATVITRKQKPFTLVYLSICTLNDTWNFSAVANQLNSWCTRLSVYCMLIDWTSWASTAPVYCRAERACDAFLFSMTRTLQGTSVMWFLPLMSLYTSKAPCRCSLSAIYSIMAAWMRLGSLEFPLLQPWTYSRTNRSLILAVNSVDIFCVTCHL